MGEKRLPRAGLEKMLEACRAYYQNHFDGDIDKLLNEWHTAGAVLEEQADLGGFTLADLACSIIRPYGLKPSATIDDLVKALEVLGWTVE